jgi:hypothetical protein
MAAMEIMILIGGLPPFDILRINLLLASMNGFAKRHIETVP